MVSGTNIWEIVDLLESAREQFPLNAQDLTLVRKRCQEPYWENSSWPESAQAWVGAKGVFVEPLRPRGRSRRAERESR
jgi:hypothetical protein